MCYPRDYTVYGISKQAYLIPSESLSLERTVSHPLREPPRVSPVRRGMEVAKITELGPIEIKVPG